MKLSLVNVNLTDRSFNTLLAFVQKSDYLLDLDLGWCGVKSHNIDALFGVLSTNKRLRHLSLQWNTVLEELN